MRNNNVGHFVDDVYLLGFLRAKKYNLPKSIKIMKSFLMTPKKYPQYFKDLDLADPSIKALAESGIELIVPERNKDGSKILIYRPSAIDTEKFNVVQCIRFGCAILEVLLREEETQIAGVTSIIDVSNLHLSILNFFSMSDFKNVVDLLANVLPCRLKAFYVVGLPGFLKQICELAVAFVPKKLRKRLHFMKSIDELKDFINVEILPVDYGGQVQHDTNIKYMMELFEKRREDVLMLNDMEADFGKHSKGNNQESNQSGLEGNFKKLEID
jgi:retinaldehyde-binding protein 1